MCLTDFLRSQFGSPSGPFGSLFVAPLLNFINMNLIRSTIDLLHPQPDDHVLDIGFGGGYSLLALAKTVPKGRVVGVDRSSDMVTAAAGLIREKKLQARVRVRRGDVAKLPFLAATFDKVLCVNTIYYWPDLGAAFGEIARVLKPGGRLAVAFRSAASLRLVTLAWSDFKRYQPEDVAQAMRQAGLQRAQVVHQSPWQIPDNVVLIGQAKKSPRRQAGRRVARSRVS